MGVSKKERKSLFPSTGTSRIGLSGMPSFCPLGPSGRMGGDIFSTVPATKRHSGGAGAELWIIRGRIWITSTNKDYSVSGIVSILSLASQHHQDQLTRNQTQSELNINHGNISLKFWYLTLWLVLPVCCPWVTSLAVPLLIRPGYRSDYCSLTDLKEAGR